MLQSKLYLLHSQELNYVSCKGKQVVVELAVQYGTVYTRVKYLLSCNC